MFVNTKTLIYDIIRINKQNKGSAFVYYERIRNLREDKDLKQKDIADILKTSANYYGDYENGKRPIPFERVIELADFYNVSLDYIAGRSNSKTNTKQVLTEKDAELLKQFHKLSDKQQGIILGRIEQMNEDNKKSWKLPNGVEVIMPKK